jgi:CRISPR-associated endonuclease Cas2
MATKNYLVCYDIADKKRLVKVRKIAYSYALGGQKSAVEAPLNNKHLNELVNKIKNVIKDEDKVNIIPYESEPLGLGKAKFINHNIGVIIV